MSWRRVRAIVRKEFSDYRRNTYMLVTMAVIPLIFLIQPVATVLSLPSAAAVTLRHKYALVYMLGIPALVPALVAAASIVTERQQGTLEPVLTTPVRRDEFMLGKALAPLLPAIVISYLVYGLFVVIIELFAQPGIPSALLDAPVVIAQIVFTPLIAAWAIWIGLAISTRSTDVRAAQQLSMLGNLPIVVVVVLISVNVIHPTAGLTIGLAIALLIGYRLGWRTVSALFDRERLVTGTRT
jgi:ABC-2 type transport system permease protein